MCAKRPSAKPGKRARSSRHVANAAAARAAPALRHKRAPAALRVSRARLKPPLTQPSPATNDRTSRCSGRWGGSAGSWPSAAKGRARWDCWRFRRPCLRFPSRFRLTNLRSSRAFSWRPNGRSLSAGLLLFRRRELRIEATLAPSRGRLIGRRRSVVVESCANCFAGATHSTCFGAGGGV